MPAVPPADGSAGFAPKNPPEPKMLVVGAEGVVDVDGFAGVVPDAGVPPKFPNKLPPEGAEVAPKTLPAGLASRSISRTLDTTMRWQAH